MEEKKKRTRKKKEAAEVMQEPIREDAGKVQDTPLDICHIWQAGDNLDSVAKELTGRSWEVPNPRQDSTIHGEKAEIGYAVDPHANAWVFYIAD